MRRHHVIWCLNDAYTLCGSLHQCFAIIDQHIAEDRHILVGVIRVGELPKPFQATPWADIEQAIVPSQVLWRFGDAPFLQVTRSCSRDNARVTQFLCDQSTFWWIANRERDIETVFSQLV